MSPVNGFQAELQARMSPAEFAAWWRFAHHDCDYCRRIFEMTGRFHCPIHYEADPAAGGAVVLIATCIDTITAEVHHSVLLLETAASNPAVTPGTYAWYDVTEDGASWDGFEYPTIDGARDAYVMDAYCAMPQMDLSFEEIPCNS